MFTSRNNYVFTIFFFFSSRRRHTRFDCDWSSDVCSSDLFLMPIEDIFSISGRGTVVTGRIERGKVKVGEEIEIVGFRDTRKTVVTGVEMRSEERRVGKECRSRWSPYH